MRLAAFAAIVMFLVGACSSGSASSSTQQANAQQAQFCGSAKTLSTSFQALKTAVSSANLQAIRSSLLVVKTNLNQVVQNGQQIKAGSVDDIKAAGQDVENSVSSLGQGGGQGDLKSQLQTIDSSVEYLGTEIKDLLSQFQCGNGS